MLVIVKIAERWRSVLKELSILVRTGIKQQSVNGQIAVEMNELSWFAKSASCGDVTPEQLGLESTW